MALEGLPKQPDRPSLNGDSNGKLAKSGSRSIADKLAQADRNADTQHQKMIGEVDRLAAKIESNATNLESHVERKMQEVDRKLADSFRRVDERIAATLDRFTADALDRLGDAANVELAEAIGVGN
jgi:aminoglycoside phosphotransferase family enzyme